MDAVSASPPQVTFAPQWHLTSTRDLLLNLVKAELTARYKTATFGMLWFLLNPALMTAVVVVVIQDVIQFSMERYHVFLLAALLPWTFFQMGLANAVSSLTRAPGMVKRVKIPRALLPIAAILGSLVHFVLSLVLLVALLAVMGILPGLAAFAFLPIVLAVHLIGLVGLGLATASLNVIYRDVEHFVQVSLRMGFWLTPIFYPLDSVPPRWRMLAMMNPMTGIIEAYRDVFVRRQIPDAAGLGIAAAFAALLLAVGVALYVRLEPSMDDYV